MSASGCSLEDSDKLLLRWSEDAFSPSREEVVEILESRVSEAVIRSDLQVVEKTKVDLVGKNSTESGIVRSCRPSGEKYIVTISMNPQGPSSGPEFDPGVLMIDNFMTEDQEAAILEEVDEEIRRQQFRALSGARAHLNTYLSGTRCDGTAALNRFLKFTLRSSTSLVSGSFLQFWGRFRQQAAGPPSTARIPAGTPLTIPATTAPATPDTGIGVSGSIQPGSLFLPTTPKSVV